MEAKEINEENNEAAETFMDDILDGSIPVTHDDTGETAQDDAADKSKAELQEQKDKYLRLFAEFDNYKRRNAKERIELMQTAGREVITSLLDVLDDSERAEKQMMETQDVSQIKEGVKLVFDKLRSALLAKGLKAMDSKNTEFDVEKHDAIAEVPAPAKDLVGKVLDEVTKGYYLNDKIIRHAKVVVGK